MLQDISKGDQVRDVILVRFRPDFRPLFLFRILPLQFLFYSIFNTSDCRFPLFCCPRKIRSADCINNGVNKLFCKAYLEHYMSVQ